MPVDSFTALVNASYAKVYYHSLKQLKNDHDAADVTQNTFLKALIAQGSLRKA